MYGQVLLSGSSRLARDMSTLRTFRVNQKRSTDQVARLVTIVTMKIAFRTSTIPAGISTAICRWRTQSDQPISAAQH